MLAIPFSLVNQLIVKGAVEQRKKQTKKNLIPKDRVPTSDICQKATIAIKSREVSGNERDWRYEIRAHHGVSPFFCRSRAHLTFPGADPGGAAWYRNLSRYFISKLNIINLTDPFKDMFIALLTTKEFANLNGTFVETIRYCNLS